MAVYTDITDEELGTLLADFDIGAPLSLKGVAEGVENSNFLLETEAGRFILTIYEKRVRADDLPYFLDLLTWLSRHGFPGAEPVADRQERTLKSVRGKPAAIVTFLPSSHPWRPPPRASSPDCPGRSAPTWTPWTPPGRRIFPPG